MDTTKLQKDLGDFKYNVITRMKEDLLRLYPKSQIDVEPLLTTQGKYNKREFKIHVDGKQYSANFNNLLLYHLESIPKWIEQKIEPPKQQNTEIKHEPDDIEKQMEIEDDVIFDDKPDEKEEFKKGFLGENLPSPPPPPPPPKLETPKAPKSETPKKGKVKVPQGFLETLSNLFGVRKGQTPEKEEWHDSIEKKKRQQEMKERATREQEEYETSTTELKEVKKQLFKPQTLIIGSEKYKLKPEKVSINDNALSTLAQVRNLATNSVQRYNLNIDLKSLSDAIDEIDKEDISDDEKQDKVNELISNTTKKVFRNIIKAQSKVESEGKVVSREDLIKFLSKI